MGGLRQILRAAGLFILGSLLSSEGSTGEVPTLNIATTECMGVGLKRSRAGRERVRLFWQRFFDGDIESPPTAPKRSGGSCWLSHQEEGPSWQTRRSPGRSPEYRLPDQFPMADGWVLRRGDRGDGALMWGKKVNAVQTAGGSGMGGRARISPPGSAAAGARPCRRSGCSSRRGW